MTHFLHNTVIESRVLEPTMNVSIFGRKPVIIQNTFIDRIVLDMNRFSGNTITIQSNTIQANDAWLEVVNGITYNFFKTGNSYPFFTSVLNFG